MPSVGLAGYILKIWNEVGECKSSGMGVIPIDWGDLDHYSNFNPITAWEAKCAILMSKTYVSAISYYGDEYKKAPYCSSEEIAEEQRRRSLTEKRRQRMMSTSKPQ